MNTTPSVAQLRKMGYRVDITHHRYVYDKEDRLCRLLHTKTIYSKYGNLRNVDPNGGRTYAIVDGIAGVADCSFRDNYNKKVGVQIALGRALKNLNYMNTAYTQTVGTPPAGKPYG